MRTSGSIPILCFVLAAVVLSGCTAAIGTPNPELLQRMAAAGEFGAAQSVRICALLDRNITEDAARRLIDEAWNQTEAGSLGLKVELVPLKSWVREGDDVATIFSNVKKMPVPPECDRIFALLDDTDNLTSGLVGGVSLTHGFALATPQGTRQVLLTPVELVRHEIYHLVGCGHGEVMDECYRRIARAKRAREGANAFFPVYLYVLDEDIRKNCGENPLIVDRREANRVAQRWAADGERYASGATTPARRCGT